MMSSQQVDPSLESEVYNFLLTVFVVSIHAPVILREILKQEYENKYGKKWPDTTGEKLLPPDKFQKNLNPQSQTLIRDSKIEDWDPTVLCYFLLCSSHFFLTTRFDLSKIKGQVSQDHTKLVIPGLQTVPELLLDFKSHCKKVLATRDQGEVSFQHEIFRRPDWKKKTYVCHDVRHEVQMFSEYRNEVAHSANGRVSIQKFKEVVRCVDAICRGLQLQFDIWSMLKDQGAILRIEKEIVGSLDLRHLMDIFQILKKFKFSTDKWRVLGTGLGLSEETLVDIGNKNETDDDRLKQCLSKWLQRTVIVGEEVTSTWVSLCEALNKIDENQIAGELQSCTARACTILDNHCPQSLSNPVTVAQILNGELVLTREEYLCIESSDVSERMKLLLDAVKKAVGSNFLSLRTLGTVLCKVSGNENLGKAILSDYAKKIGPVEIYSVSQRVNCQLQLMRNALDLMIRSFSYAVLNNLSSDTLRSFFEENYPYLEPSDDLHTQLRQQCSLTNIEILEELVQEYSIEDAKRHLEEYKKELDNFCESALIQSCLKEDFGTVTNSPCLRSETAVYIFDWNPKQRTLKEIREILTRKFGLMFKIDTGNSIVITCIFDRSLLGSVFVNAMENFVQLQEKGLIELTVGNYTIRKREGDKCMYVQTSIVTETVEKDEVIEEIDLLEKFLKQLEIQKGQDDGSTAGLEGSIQNVEEMDKDQMMAESDELSLTQSAKRITPGHESLSEEEELLTEQFSKSSLSEADKLSTLQSEEIPGLERMVIFNIRTFAEYQLMKLMSISESDELSSIQSTKRITPGHESLSEKEKPLTEQKLSLSEADKLSTLQSKEIPVSSKAKTAFNTKSEEMIEEEITHKGDTHLHKHQMEAVLRVRDYLKHKPGEPAIVVLPVGCGRIGVAVLAAYALDVRKVLVITSSEKISEQFHEAFMGKPSFLVEQGIVTEEDLKQLIPAYAEIKQSSEISHKLQKNLTIFITHKLDQMLHEIPHDNFDLVVVDEAHHYPADTWRVPVDHFKHSKQLFLTPTPFHHDECLLTRDHICYELKMKDAADMGIIRPLKFHEIHTDKVDIMGIEVYMEMSRAISAQLDEHDRADRNVTHQALVLTSSRQEAMIFIVVYNSQQESKPGRRSIVDQRCDFYETSDEVFRFREKTLVIAGKLLKTIDHKSISVVAIARNVQAHALFAQFIGQAVQKAHPEETIEAVLISHRKYSQKAMFEQHYEGLEKFDTDKIKSK